MARLILVNGAPSTGKSTLARRYADDHPLTLDLDLDVVRSLLGSWLSAWSDAGVLTRRMALEMARVHLSAGHDVVVPQYLGRPDYVLDLAALADSARVPFVEVALLTPPDLLTARFDTRSRAGATQAHRDAAALQPQLDTDVAAMHARVLEVSATRPATRFLEPTPDDLDATYRTFLRMLA